MFPRILTIFLVCSVLHTHRITHKDNWISCDDLLNSEGNDLDLENIKLTPKTWLLEYIPTACSAALEKQRNLKRLTIHRYQLNKTILETILTGKSNLIILTLSENVLHDFPLKILDLTPNMKHLAINKNIGLMLTGHSNTTSNILRLDLIDNRFTVFPIKNGWTNLNTLNFNGSDIDWNGTFYIHKFPSLRKINNQDADIFLKDINYIENKVDGTSLATEDTEEAYTTSSSSRTTKPSEPIIEKTSSRNSLQNEQEDKVQVQMDKYKVPFYIALLAVLAIVFVLVGIWLGKKLRSNNSSDMQSANDDMTIPLQVHQVSNRTSLD